jgi:DNA topoisomerase I
VRKSQKSKHNIAPKEAALAAGLTYAETDAPGFSRRRRGRGFVYLDTEGRPLTDLADLERIHRLVIPPAWREVWTCADPAGHIQAIGFDERGRRQYRYHDRFRTERDEAKFEHLIAFAEALPRLRRQIEADMAKPCLGRAKVLATIVLLLERTLCRVGNTAYARQNHSYGLTTLLARHATLDGAELRLNFKGKSGRSWELSLRDRRIARVIRSCQELPGQALFQYLDDDGERQSVTSADVNAYLKEAAGADISTKDFRTWAGTVHAALALASRAAEGAPPSKRAVAAAIAEVAGRLGNTPAVCRKCYVHPAVVEAYLAGELALRRAPHSPALDPAEAAVLAFLRRGIARHGKARTPRASGRRSKRAGTG